MALLRVPMSVTGRKLRYHLITLPRLAQPI